MKHSLLIVSLDFQGQTPEWLRILPLGKVELRDSRAGFEVTPAALSAIVENFREGGVDLVVDYEHQSLQGERAPAAGWIKDLEARADGLYARIEWTATALRHIKEGEYRYYSPVLKLGEKRVPAKLMHLGLTNVPAIKNLAPLLAAKYGETEVLIMNYSSQDREQMAKSGEAMPDGSFPITNREDLKNAVQSIGRAKDPAAAKKHIMARAQEMGMMDMLPADWTGNANKMDGGKQAMKEKLIRVLALKAETTEAEAFAALESRLKLAGALPEIAEALGLEKEADAAKITGTIVALKQGAEQLAVLSTKLAALEQETAQGKAQKAVNEALAARKITPAQTEWALRYATGDPQGFKAFIDAAVPILAAKHLEIPKDAKTPGGMLDESELAICKNLGVKPENYLAAKQSRAQAE